MSFYNGMVIPLMSEFLDYQQGDGQKNKQDCEQKAFHRLAERIRKAFPRLPIMLLLDGLYANGPIMQHCHDYNWDYMIVLKAGSLSTVRGEFESLLLLEKENRHQQKWGDRKQSFQWINHIRYDYGPNGKHHIEIHVVVCHEEWEAIDDKIGEIVSKTMRHAWISSRPVNHLNAHARCNLGARYRWGIEAGFLVEKHQGYSYEHLFAKNWNAMKGYHYLMRLAHLFNTLARFSSELAGLFKQYGVRDAIGFIRETLTGPWLAPQEVDQQLKKPFRLRLV